MEQEIKNAVGLGNPELVIESKPEPKPTVTIYDFSSLLSKHEPQKNNDNRYSSPRLLGDKCADCENHKCTSCFT